MDSLTGWTGAGATSRFDRVLAAMESDEIAIWYPAEALAATNELALRSPASLATASHTIDYRVGSEVLSTAA